MRPLISEATLKLVGLTIDDYLSWCEYHQYNSKLRENKTDFFRLIHENLLIKKNDKLYENGVMICLKKS